MKGLYAVGNDARQHHGGNYPGAGITLGPALTFGYVVGQALATPANRSADVVRLENLANTHAQLKPEQTTRCPNGNH